jgi:hypothetical protein
MWELSGLRPDLSSFIAVKLDKHGIGVFVIAFVAHTTGFSVAAGLEF